MEEFFELIVAAIAIAVGVTLKNSKKKAENAKKRGDATPDAADGFDWDLIERPEAKPEKEELKMQIPYAPAEPAAKPAPAIIQPELAAVVKAAMNAVAGAAKPQPARAAAAHPEGCHSEEGPAPGHPPKKLQPKPKGAANARHTEVPKPASARRPARPQDAEVAPVRVDAAQLRQAVIMSEVLGKPVALRGGIKHR